MHAIVGHNCRFLQGPDTDRDQVHKLKVALAEGREEVVILKNYRKDGNFYPTSYSNKSRKIIHSGKANIQTH
jgi:hypothetical protein